jgi:hypothetical protein
VKILEFFGYLLAAVVWFTILVIYIASIPVALLVTVIVFPIWFVVDKLRVVERSVHNGKL